MPLPRSTGEKSPLSTRMRRVRLGIGAIALAAASLFTLAATLAAEASTPGLPPTSQQTSPQTSAPRSGDPLNPFFSDSGLISLSVDAIGTNDPAGAALKVHKNAAGAKVRKAFLFGGPRRLRIWSIFRSITMRGST